MRRRVIHNKVTLTTAILIHIMPIRILITATHTPFTAIGPSALGSAGAGVGVGAGAVAGTAAVGVAARAGRARRRPPVASSANVCGTVGWPKSRCECGGLNPLPSWIRGPAEQWRHEPGAAMCVV